MRFAISIPQYARDSRFDDDAFRAYLRHVEELGLFESAWAQEQVIGAAGSLAPLQTLAYAAACTEQVRLGCAVFVLKVRDSAFTALFGVACLGSLAASRPMMFVIGRSLSAGDDQGGEGRIAHFE